MNGASEADTVVRVAIEGSMFMLKVTGKASMEILKFVAAASSQQAKTSGQLRLKNLLKSGSELKVFTIQGDDKFKTFAKAARDYGIVYSVVRRTDSDVNGQVYDIMVKAEDASKLNRIINKYGMIELPGTAEGQEIPKEQEPVEQVQLADVRELLAKMIQPDENSKGETVINPELAPERENLSGASLEQSKAETEEAAGVLERRVTPGTTPEKRPSVKEDIKEIKEELEKGTLSESGIILGKMMEKEEPEENEALDKLAGGIQDAFQSLMDSINKERGEAGGSNGRTV